MDLEIFLSSRFLLSLRYCHLLLWLTLFYRHLLAEVASSLGVRSSVYCISGQINWLIDWLIDIMHNKCPGIYHFQTIEELENFMRRGLTSPRSLSPSICQISNDTTPTSAPLPRSEKNWLRLTTNRLCDYGENWDNKNEILYTVKRRNTQPVNTTFTAPYVTRANGKRRCQ